jgi:hypothetical protein
MEQEVWSVLADCSQVVRTPTITDLKDLVDALSDLGVQDVFREAVVRPIDVMAATSIAYWETAGVNRGLAIRTFRTREDALAWLDE